MKKYIGMLFVFLLSMVFCSCSGEQNSMAEDILSKSDEMQMQETYIAVFENRGDIIWDTSLERPWNDSTYVVRATVTDIGDAFLRDGMTITERDRERDLMQKLMGIRLPITIMINEVFKGDIAVGDTHLLLEQYGAYGGYYVAPNYAEYEEGCEYILFIVHSDQWDRSIAIPQSTVKLNPISAASSNSDTKDFLPSTASPLFEQYENANELLAAIRLLSQE